MDSVKGDVQSSQVEMSGSLLELKSIVQTQSACYGVSWVEDEDKIVCAMEGGGVEIRSAGDLSLIRRIEIKDVKDVLSAYLVDDNLITKIRMDSNNVSTYIGTIDQPLQRLIQKIETQNGAFLTVYKSQIFDIDCAELQLRVFSFNGEEQYNINLEGDASNPIGVHVTPDDSLVVTDVAIGTVRKYRWEAGRSKAELAWQCGGLEKCKNVITSDGNTNDMYMCEPTGVTSDRLGNIYSPSTDREIIYQISPDGMYDYEQKDNVASILS